MATFYADENFPLQVTESLRQRGHDVLTALDAGQANQAIPDEDVLAFAQALDRTLLTLNRWEFIALHARTAEHSGIVVCTHDADAERMAAAIDKAVTAVPARRGLLFRVIRPA